MGTNQSALSCSDGATTFYCYTNGTPLYNYTGCEPGQIDGCHGLRDFYESRGYGVVQNYSQYIYGYNGNTIGFTFEQYMQEIDAGRPVLIQVTGHTMLGYGYDEAGTLVYLHDTWDYDSHTMTWGGSYSGLAHYGVCVVQLEPGTSVPVANFSASTTTPFPGVSVAFTDLSSGNPLTWSWTFSPNTITYLGGTTSSSQNPQVSFDNSDYYTVSLTATNANGSDTETKTNYIYASSPGLWTGITSSDWNTASNWDDGIVPLSNTSVTISPDAIHWPNYPGDFIVGTQCSTMTIVAGTEMTITGNFTINAGSCVTFSGDGELSISGDWNNNGTFSPGSGTVNFSGTSLSTINAPLPSIANYERSTFTKSMTALVSPVTSTAAGDDGSQVIPLGFTFIYAGTAYTQAKISTNGCLILNQSGTTTTDNSVLFSSIAPNTTLAPWWDDLIDDGTSFLYYKTEGSSPNRVFTAEWSRVKTYYTIATSRISFQVKLYETTNIIEFHYGNLESGTHYGGESASIGIEDATGGSGHFIEATTGSTTTGIINLISTINWPAVNYRFTPPVALQTFKNLTISKSSANVDFNTNTVVEGSFNLMPGASFNIINGKTVTVGE
jgi:PKD repeat protein